MRKKLDKANRLSLEIPVNGPSKSANDKENLFLSNDQASIQLQYWTPEWLCSSKNKDGTRLQEFLDLFAENMGEQYKNSSWGFDLEEKKAELRHIKARFLALLGINEMNKISSEEDGKAVQDLEGFCHYRFEYDDEDSPSEAVLYVYELQIRDKYRRQGLGRKIMELLEKMAKEYEIPKVMLTVFFANEQAMDFYKNLHYSVDETSPSQFGEKVDYEILSKKI